MQKSAGPHGPASSKSDRVRNPWHYQPPLPIAVSPYFSWPPNVPAILKWMVGGWFPLSERLIILMLALMSSIFFHPAIERCREISPDWVAQIYVRNFALMCFVAGGLHLYFYVWRRQGDEYRFDKRPLVNNSRVFTFNSQIRDNMFWTLASGVSIWTAYEVLMMWALANGYAPALSLPGDLVWLVLLIFLLPMWETTHFFLIHRLIHSSPLYQRIHALHHRNTNVGPWSGLSMHPAEHLIYLSTVMIHFIVPSNPMLITFHLMYFTLSAASTHTGYQGYFTCNYGGLETPWDQWTGSFHDGTAGSHQQFLARRKGRAKT